MEGRFQMRLAGDDPKENFDLLVSSMCSRGTWVPDAGWKVIPHPEGHGVVILMERAPVYVVAEGPAVPA